MPSDDAASNELDWRPRKEETQSDKDKRHHRLFHHPEGEKHSEARQGGHMLLHKPKLAEPGEDEDRRSK